MRGQVRGVEYLGLGWGPSAGLGTAVGGGDNEVYQTELVRWVGDMEQCEQTAVEMDHKCKVGSDAEQKVKKY